MTLNFKAPDKYRAVLRRKYRNFAVQGSSFKINGYSFCIDQRCLARTETARYFAEMVMHLLSTCDTFKVPVILQKVIVTKDDEIDACNVKYRGGNLIFLPHCRCKVDRRLCRCFNLIHELFHAWTGSKYQSLEDEEIFADLIATVALKRSAKTAEEFLTILGIISNPACSYIARSKKHEGKYLAMLQDPEKALRTIIENTSGGTIRVH